MQTVTYGYFHTRDFSINFWDAIDKDKIKTKMTLNPPGTRVQSKGKVSANARFFWYRESITIDFDNSWHNLGAYKMRFNDAKMYRNGTVALTAKFMRLPKPVSEPSSLALVLVGALGLLLARRLRA
ncbi:MAG: PEP-CTERM sorting domain-containing protein [Pseudomonadota bacterium]